MTAEFLEALKIRHQTSKKETTTIVNTKVLNPYPANVENKVSS